MRWGIGNEVNNTHMATTICLNEIKICKELSIGPNFIVNFLIKFSENMNI